MDLQRLRSLCEALPIFPLPRVVLMPGELLPLHVFEPRYRALVSYCEAGERVMGVATLQPGFEADYYGAPQIYPEIGIGELVSCQPYPDGRSTIVLKSVGRCQLLEELESDYAFRQVRGSVSVPDESGVSGAVLRLKTLILQLGGLSSDATEEARHLVGLEDADLLDSLARKLLTDTVDRRRYLAADRALERVAMVEDRLATFLQVTSPIASA